MWNVDVVEFYVAALLKGEEVDAGICAFVYAILLFMAGFLECAPNIFGCAVDVADDGLEHGDGFCDFMAFCFCGVCLWLKDGVDFCPFFWF